MSIIRKIKTAFTVLHQYGFQEVCGLLSDNLVKFRFYLARRLSSVFRKTLGRILLHSAPRRGGKIRVMYVTTDFEAFHSQTVRYRIHNLRQALRGKAHTRFELIEGAVCHDRALLGWADIIILMRTTWTDNVGELVTEAKKQNIPVVFDIDDIIFLPEYAEHYCRALDDTSEENIRLRRSEFEGFDKTFKSCSYATASTSFITEKMERAGTRAFVIHNGLNKKQLRIARHTRKENTELRSIGYLSGTKTHDRDFAQALPALCKIIVEYPDVVLRVAGYLDLETLPTALTAKIQPACYMNWSRLMKYGAQNYINIAPLDITNPFCHAKSELKYFEAAAVGVPTVASATDTFSRCINNEQNGLLASTDEEWYNALKRLLDDRKFYMSVAEKAQKHAFEHYSPQASAREAMTAYNAIIADYKSHSKS